MKRTNAGEEAKEEMKEEMQTMEGRSNDSSQGSRGNLVSHIEPAAPDSLRRRQLLVAGAAVPATAAGAVHWLQLECLEHRSGDPAEHLQEKVGLRFNPRTGGRCTERANGHG